MLNWAVVASPSESPESDKDEPTHTADVDALSISQNGAVDYFQVTILHTFRWQPWQDRTTDSNGFKKVLTDAQFCCIVSFIPQNSHYASIIPYAGIIPYAATSLLFSKLCRHKYHKPSHSCCETYNNNITFWSNIKFRTFRVLFF